LLLGLLGLAAATSWADSAENYEVLRQRLVTQISQDVINTSAYLGKSSLDERVMQVMGTVGLKRSNCGG
jgi:hypothetical protein